MNSDKLGVRNLNIAMALPVESFGLMAEANWQVFHDTYIVDEKELLRFWDMVADEPWFVSHPFRSQILACPSKAIPVRLHGDDASMTRLHSFLSVNFCSCISVGVSTQDCKIGIGVLPLRDIMHNTTEEFYAPIVHSFWSAAAGMYPETDHLGEEWPPGPRRDRAGHPLPRGMRLVWVETVGDWKWKKEAHDLKHNYSAEQICSECKATKKGRLKFTDCTDTAPHHLEVRTHDEYLASFPGEPPALSKLPGFHVVHSLRGDWMHEVCQGVGQSAAGNCLLELVEEGAFGVLPAGGPWKIRYNILLKSAYKDYRQWCKKLKIAQSQPSFNVSRLSLGEGLCHYPCLKGKAANSMWVIQWLNKITSSRPITTNHHRHRATLLWALAHSWRMIRDNGIWFDQPCRLAFGRVGKKLLRSNVLLSVRSKRLGVRRWQLKPKNHALQHSINFACRTGRNPGSHYTFKDEDFVGTKKKVATKCWKEAGSAVIEREQYYWALKLHNAR